ncbi:MAG: TMEM165/GDT1 family protein [Actinobacteria bacterium]|nr:TMEM165/GDT1 family protein [Actinomycetota bacterium]
MLEAFLTALSVVFVAELGDKSQLLTLTFAARYRARPVLIGLVIATATLMAVSVGVGALAGAALPERPLQLVAGVVFLGFAVWTLRDDDADDDADADDDDATPARSPVATVAAAFALSELGDKTMLATITLASTRPSLGVWAGATLGMVAANALALLVGDRLAARVPERTMRWAAAGLFAVFGVLLLLGVG